MMGNKAAKQSKRDRACTAVKHRACARVSILAGCAPIPNAKFQRKTITNQHCLVKVNVKRLKNSQETVTGKNSKEKKTRDFSSVKLIQVQVFTILF